MSGRPAPRQPAEPWPAPAKLNLFLHVTGRRADGYHLLQTVFQFLDFGDDLTFEPGDDGAISVTGNHPEIEPDQDLIVRAARLLSQAGGPVPGVRIRVRKRLPRGGGLGGGSSDAATTLVALNRIWGLDLPAGELAALGLTLGADVPVFVHGHAAWGEGVGEVLRPVDPPEHWFVVAHPGIEIPTAEIFHDPDLTRNTPAITIRDFTAGAGRNDCQDVVTRSYPQVGELLDWMGQHGPARMTGTGACVFVPCPDETAAQAIVAGLPERWWGIAARARNRSPLLERLARETGG